MAIPPSSEKTFKKLSELHEWEQNPRRLSPENFDRLKEQLKKLGQYKPLLITSDGTVIGGNMRLKALRDLGEKTAWVSLVEPKDEQEKLEYALSDNDRIGSYDESALASLLKDNPEIDLGTYRIDLGEAMDLNELLALVERERGTDVDRTDEKLDTYLNATIKQIVLYFSNDEFASVQGRLEALRTDCGFSNNTELFLEMLKFYEGHKNKAA